MRAALKVSRQDDTWSKWPETTTVKILEGKIKERLTISIQSVMGARSYLRRPAKPARFSTRYSDSFRFALTLQPYLSPISQK